MAQPHELKYEETFKRLEKLVDELEKPELDLDARFKKFEEALHLSGALSKKLAHTKKRVELLVKKHLGETARVAFDVEETDEENEDSEDEDGQEPSP